MLITGLNLGNLGKEAMYTIMKQHNNVLEVASH